MIPDKNYPTAFNKRHLLDNGKTFKERIRQVPIAIYLTLFGIVMPLLLFTLVVSILFLITLIRLGIVFIP
jgi:hypothetical protein